MAGEIAARRYAQAVFQIAQERDELEKWRSDLGLLADIFSSAELTSLLDDPKIKFDDKVNVIAQNLPEASEMLLNLVKLLTSKRRVKIMPQIAEQFARLVDRQQGIEHAEVTTAAPIDKEAETALTEQLTKTTGSRVVISTKVDPEIIGGFIARVGDKVIDGSVRNKLRKLKRELAQTT